MKMYFLKDKDLNTVESGIMLDLINLAHSKLNTRDKFRIVSTGIEVVMEHHSFGTIKDLIIPQDTKEKDIKELTLIKIKDYDALKGIIVLDCVLGKVTIEEGKVINIGCKFDTDNFGVTFNKFFGKEGTIYERIANIINSKIENFIVEFNPKIYLGNAFSLQMLDVSKKGMDLNIKPVDADFISYTKGISSKEIISIVGHKDTASVISNLVGFPVEFNRESVTLSKFDTLIVAQVVGGRLAEGCTELSEGVEIKFFMVTTNVVGQFI